MYESKRARLAELDAEVRRLREELGLTAASAERTGADAPPELAAHASVKQQRRLLTVERLAQLASWTWDLQSQAVVWSAGMYRILQLEAAAVVPSAELFFAHIHPDDRERVVVNMQQGLAAGVVEPIEARVARPSAELREVLIEGTLLRTDAGERTQAVITLLDLTDQRSSARQLAEAIAELNEAQRLAKLASWQRDLRTGHYKWSEHMYELLGVERSLAPSEALFFAHVHPEERPTLEALRTRARRTQALDPFESRLLHANGKVLHVIYRAAVQTDATGAVIGYRGVIQDITERKLLEEQLRHSQKMEAVGTLAGGVAHDFNNYLMIISGHLERLGQQLPAEHPACISVREIAQAYQRCARLTQQLLTLSRKRKAQLETVNLASLVSQLSSLIGSALGEKVRLELDVQASDALILADPLQIEHLLMNLVVNSRDAMPDGGRLRIGIQRTTQANLPQALVRLTVSDTGCGIANELQSRIFEPFFTTKQVGQGTGLGLSTVYAIVQEGGGQITLESRLGRGTTFRIDWPECGAEIEQRPAQSAPRAARAQTGHSVLLVEDVPQLREIVAQQLQRAGYTVMSAADGNAALEVLAQTPVDLVLSDMVMPQLGGALLVDLVRARHPGVRCILMTGYHADVLPAALQEPVLRKPFTTEELLQALQDALCASNAHAAVTSDSMVVCQTPRS